MKSEGSVHGGGAPVESGGDDGALVGVASATHAPMGHDVTTTARKNTAQILGFCSQ
jgi:hypothetical protein